MHETTVTTSLNETNLNTHSRFLPWIVCLTGALFFFYEFIQMNMFNAISGALLTEFSLNAVQLGNLSAAYFYSNVLFLFPAGMILDRFSTRKVMLTALTTCFVATFLFSLSTSVLAVGICRFLTGIGSAFCFLSCVRLASRWFPASRLALVIGLVITFAMLGGFVAQTPLTLLINYIGWRNALMVDAGLGALITLIIGLVVRDFPAHYVDIHASERKQLSQLGYWTSMRLAFLKPRNWLCGIYTCLLNLPIFLLGGIWGILYLQHTHDFSKTQASYITSMLFLGTVIGSPLAGWISDKIQLRKLPMMIGALLGIATIFSIMFIPHPSLLLLMILFLVLGLVTGTQVISYPTVAESNPKLLTATSVSVVSITTLSGGFIFPPLYGWLMHHHWNGVMAQGTPIYSAGDYAFAMWLFPVTLIVGFIASLLVQETHARRQEN